MLATEEKPQALEYWPLSQLRPNPLNPRGPVDPSSVEDLAASIRSKGILEPLIVTPDGWIVAGHRRRVAAQLAGLTVAPIVIRDLSKADQLEIMLVENLQREDLTPLQEARAYQRMLEQGRKQMDIARQIGVPHTRVQARLIILKLQPNVQDLFDRGELPLQAAPTLSRVADPVQQGRLALMVARRRFTVDKLKEMVARGDGIQVVSKPVQVAPASSRIAEDDDEESADLSRKPGRADAVALLEAQPSRTFTFAKLHKLFDAACGICGDCGMSTTGDICKDCPLPDMVRRLAAQ